MIKTSYKRLKIVLALKIKKFGPNFLALNSDEFPFINNFFSDLINFWDFDNFSNFLVISSLLSIQNLLNLLLLTSNY